MNSQRHKPTVYQALNLGEERYPSFLKAPKEWLEEAIERVHRDGLQLNNGTQRQHEVLSIVQKITDTLRLWELPISGRKLVEKMQQLEIKFYVPNEKNRNDEAQTTPGSYGDIAFMTNDQLAVRIDLLIALRQYDAFLTNVVYIHQQQSKKARKALGPRPKSKEVDGYWVRTFTDLKRIGYRDKCKPLRPLSYNTCFVVLTRFLGVNHEKKVVFSGEAEDVDENQEEDESDEEEETESADEGESLGSRDTDSEEAGSEDETESNSGYVSADGEDRGVEIPYESGSDDTSSDGSASESDSEDSKSESDTNSTVSGFAHVRIGKEPPSESFAPVIGQGTKKRPAARLKGGKTKKLKRRSVVQEEEVEEDD